MRQDELTDVRERGEKPWDLVNWQNIAKRTLRIQHVDPELGSKIEVLKAFSIFFSMCETIACASFNRFANLPKDNTIAIGSTLTLT